jgi:hypothetical protein
MRDAPSFALEPQIAWHRAMAREAAAGEAHRRAEELAREAVRIASSTDFVSLQGDALVDLASVLLPHRPPDAIKAADEALERYVLKQNLAGARRARAMRERANASES